MPRTGRSSAGCHAGCRVPCPRLRGHDAGFPLRAGGTMDRCEPRILSQPATIYPVPGRPRGARLRPIPVAAARFRGNTYGGSLGQFMSPAPGATPSFGGIRPFFASALSETTCGRTPGGENGPPEGVPERGYFFDTLTCCGTTVCAYPKGGVRCWWRKSARTRHKSFYENTLRIARIRRDADFTPLSRYHLTIPARGVRGKVPKRALHTTPTPDPRPLTPDPLHHTSPARRLWATGPTPRHNDSPPAGCLTVGSPGAIIPGIRWSPTDALCPLRPTLPARLRFVATLAAARCGSSRLCTAGQAGRGTRRNIYHEPPLLLLLARSGPDSVN
jgi:hypothetical protein